jgi:hypothetical protein
MKLTGLVALAALVVSAGGVYALADEAEDAFESLFGADYKRVTGTRDPSDDAALAAQILKAAKDPATHAALVSLLCEKAYELGVKHPSGCETAAQAMDVLAERAPDRKSECLGKAASVRERQYEAAKGPDREKCGQMLLDALVALAAMQEKAGSEAEAIAACRKAVKVAVTIGSGARRDIEAWIERLGCRLRARKQATDLKNRLQASPEDAAARKDLVRVLVVELDDPGQAATHIDESCDPGMRRYVPAAAQGIEAAPEVACLELAEWYRRLADAAGISAGGKVAVLKRAYRYYQRYLDQHGAADLSGSQATLAMRRIEEALSKLGASLTYDIVPGPWIDLLKLVVPAKDAAVGTWQSWGSALTVKPMSEAQLVIPCAPEGNFEFQVRFVRTENNGEVRFLFPAASCATVLLLDRFTKRSEFHDVTQGDASAYPGKITNGQDYVVDIQVVQSGGQTDVNIQMNGKPYIRWRGPGSAVRSVTGNWLIRDPRCVGLGAHDTGVTFKDARLRMLSGRARFTR